MDKRCPLSTNDYAAKMGAKFASLAGQSSTLLPDGSTLVLGGIGAAGAARVAAKPARGLLAQLAVTLRRPRAWHSATVLPDGSVLAFGGLDQRGLVAEAEIYDPARHTSEVLAAGLAPAPTTPRRCSPTAASSSPEASAPTASR
jgi:galactose oxidase-like protein